ncbi:MAG: insulinase family protein [Syntrophomonadaceae bacterium]|nr:insulinase family protein [Syntrophomonadaceae bacterium]
MIHSCRLDNGCFLVTEEIPYVRSVAIGIYIRVGSRHEPEHIKGAAHFIEHMLFKGTESRSARDIAESFESIGGQLNAFTAKEYTCLYARTLDEHLALAMDILFDMLFNARFNPRDFENEKNVIIEEIHMYEDTPDDLIHDVFSRHMWSGHPLGSPILGTKDSVAAFERSHVCDFYRDYYQPGNMVIAVAGNIDTQQVKDFVCQQLAEQPSRVFAVRHDVPQSYRCFTNLVDKATEQVQICIGVPGITYFDDRRHALNIMNNIFGGGMSSRLFQSLREELGLAYSVYSYPASYSDSGAYSIYIGTGPGRIDTCFEALYGEIKGFLQKGITTMELERTQQLIKSSMYLGLENVMNRMSRLGKSMLMYGEVHSPEEIMSRILAVKADEVHELAQYLLDKEPFSLAAIAPGETLKQLEKAFNRHWTACAS